MKTSLKRILSFVLVVLTLVGCAAPALAATISAVDCGHYAKDGYDVEAYGPKKEPTCSDWGYQTYHCKECDKYVNRDYVKPTGKHDTEEVTVKEVTCVSDGQIDTVCKDCKKVIDSKVITANGAHDYIYPSGYDCLVSTDDATCKNCSETGLHVDAKSDHNWGAATSGSCTTAVEKTCVDCGAKKTEPTGSGHDFKAEVTKPPKHCVDGVMTYTCSKCNESYTLVIDAADAHDFSVAVADVPATCYSEGKKDVKKCSACEATTAGTTVPRLSHNLKDVAEVPAKCEVKGVSAHKACQNAGCIYTEGRVETVALGHDMGAPVVVNPVCKTETNGSSTSTCSRCGKVETQNIPFNHDWKVETTGTIAPTCDTYGLEYKVCITCGKATTVVLEPLNHKHPNGDSAGVAVGATPPTCYQSGNTGGIQCSLCKEMLNNTGTIIEPTGDHTLEQVVDPTCTTEGKKVCKNGSCPYSEAIPATGHNFPDAETVVVNATCIAKGEVTKLCTVCNTPAEGYPKETPIDPDGHTKDSGIVLKNPTCDFSDVGGATGEGVIAYVCTLCGDMWQDTIDPLAHEHDPSDAGTVVTPATCTTKGWVKFACIHKDYAEEIHYYLVEIPATGHAYADVASSAVAATCTTAGKAVDQECANCGDIKTGAEIPAAGHTWAEDTPAVSAGCTIPGAEAVYKCSVCGDTDPDRNGAVINALGHDHTKVVAGFAVHCVDAACTLHNGAACDGSGLTDGLVCSRCGDVKTAQTTITATLTNGHIADKYTTAAEVPAKCWKDGKEASWACTACGKSDGGAPITRPTHTMTTKAIVIVVEGACTPITATLHYCTECETPGKFDASFVQADRTKYEKVTDYQASKPHVNADNTPLVPGWACDHEIIVAAGEFKAWDAADFECVGCKQVFNPVHNKTSDVHQYAATCIAPAYEIAICDACEYEDIKITGTDFDIVNGHDWEVKEISPATYTSAAVVEMQCKLHADHKQPATATGTPKTAFTINLEVFNPLEKDDDITNDIFVKSGVLGVKIWLKVDGDEAINITSAQISFRVSKNLKYLANEINAPDGFTGGASTVPTSNSWNNGCIFTVYSPVKDAKMEIKGDYQLGTVYFLISDKATKFDTSLNHFEIQKLDFAFEANEGLYNNVYSDVKDQNGNYISYKLESAFKDQVKVPLTKLGEGTSDAIIDINDVTSVVNRIEGEYNAALDIDKNGLIEVADVRELHKYVLGQISDYEFYNTGVDKIAATLEDVLKVDIDPNVDLSSYLWTE